MPDKAPGYGQQRVGHGSLLHDFTRKDEEGDSHEWERVQGPEHLLRKKYGRQISNQHACKDSKTDGNSDRYGKNQQNNKCSKGGNKNWIHE